MPQNELKPAIDFPRDRLLTLREVRSILGISRPTLATLLNLAVLPYVQVGKRRKIKPDVLETFLQNQRS